jgi:hypothetical protein
MTRRVIPLWPVLLLMVVGLSACRASVTPIKTLLDDPSRFDKQTVRIAGDVGDAIGVLGYGAYRVDDGTGKLLVVTKAGGAPRSGAKVGVEGVFHAAFTLGTETAAVLEESSRYTP